jgi:hypothetical protein
MKYNDTNYTIKNYPWGWKRRSIRRWQIQDIQVVVKASGEHFAIWTLINRAGHTKRVVKSFWA